MLDCRVVDRTGFRARLCSRSIADISVARVEATPSSVVRSAELIRSSHDDSHIVMLQISGSTGVQQGERSRTMCPGAFDVVQADRPYVLDFPRDFSQYVIKLPRGMQPLGGAISPTAARFVRSLARDLLDPDIEPDRVCDEVTARALQELLCGRAAEPALLHPIPDLYGRAVAMVREKMFEPLLSRNRVADELGVSVRTLARAFAMHGTTFDRSLWNYRLEAAYEALLSNRASASVTEVALRQIALALTQEIPVGAIFYPFGNDLHVELLSQLQARAINGPQLRIGCCAVHEAAVHLELIEWDIPQLGQR